MQAGECVKLVELSVGEARQVTAYHGLARRIRYNNIDSEADVLYGDLRLSAVKDCA